MSRLLTPEEAIVYTGNLPRVKKIVEDLTKDKELCFKQSVLDEHIDSLKEFSTLDFERMFIDAAVLVIDDKGEDKPAGPSYWHGKMVCNDCPRIWICDAVGEWFDPEYSMGTSIYGIAPSIRYAPKDNVCPYVIGG